MDPAYELATARRARGVSVRGLARMAGVSATTVSRIERGENDPTIKVLEQLLGVLGRSLVVSDEPPRPSRTAPGMLAPRQALALHRAAVREMVEAAGLSEVCLPIDPDDPEHLLLLAVLPEGFDLPARVTLVNELRFLLGCDVELIGDMPDLEDFQQARAEAESL